MSRLLLPVLVGLLFLIGCGDPPIEVSVSQPIEFPHRTHLEYFSSGRHRAERIQMHLTIFDQTDVPPELAEGRCTECHDDLSERTACAGCHVLSQDAALRGRTDVRRCAACHRGVWTGSAATIPSAAVCVSCHGPDSGNGHPAEKRLRADLSNAGDVRWVQINTVAPSVYFSHSAHVRYASMTCTDCHADVKNLAKPPSTARIFVMGDCLGCHVERRASTDCLTCHK
ncbi:MAG: hypothetical protein HYX76_01210 [Acidobacteria bacterium]|nr:hypothetical protein [Acidobacteriota bacterium]